MDSHGLWYKLDFSGGLDDDERTCGAKATDGGAVHWPFLL